MVPLGLHREHRHVANRHAHRRLSILFVHAESRRVLQATRRNGRSPQTHDEHDYVHVHHKQQDVGRWSWQWSHDQLRSTVVWQSVSVDLLLVYMSQIVLNSSSNIS